MFNIPGFSNKFLIYESLNSLVYRAIQAQNQQPVILKVLKENYPTPQELARYRSEYKILKALDLPGVIQVYDLQNYQNTLVMFVEDFGGQSLQYWLNQRSFTIKEFLEIAIATSESLRQIHAANIIHKDINPANIVFNSETKQVKIIDFGISTQVIREIPTLKNPNILEGTLAYISPEQTGRMNRSLDYRTDFYSLGVTFYELLTKQIPFQSKDPLDLVHSHLAKTPLTPEKLNPKIPPILGEIVLKLMAKSADNRYQSASEIKADLEQCLKQLNNTGDIASFTLTSQGCSNKFKIPQKLYGREQEIATLMRIFEAVQFQSQILLIAGYSGIGKSALVQEIYKPITKERGYFIAGKFDQYQRNIPYRGLIIAFQQLVKQLLAEPEPKLTEWRTKILAALGSNGQIIINIIPEVELIIGPQPPVPEVMTNEAQNRFNLVFQSWLKVFTKPEHPLTIFLDDLQWADLASLQLIKVIMKADLKGLFLIGAYRDNELTAGHPLLLTLAEIQEKVSIDRLELGPLDLPTVTNLIADTLNTSTANVEELAELVLAKTGGNPFFLNQFLELLYSEKLLQFKERAGTVQGHWYWDLQQIKAQGFTDNVVELMTNKIDKLPEDSQRSLKLAACIGNQFDLKTLSISKGESLEVTVASLDAAIAENLVIPMGSREDVELALISSDYALPEYKFAHDRIQQAAYSLIPETEKSTTHYQIGQLLLQQISTEAREANIFALVNQLNYGTSSITQQAEREELAALNLTAVRKAKAAAAHQAAYEYAMVGLSLLDENAWQQQYKMTLALHELAAELSALCGEFEQMEQLIDIVTVKTDSLLEQVKVHQIKIQSYASRDKISQALTIGQESLKQLGVNFPASPTPTDIQQAIAEIQDLISDRKIEDLVDLPLMTNQEYLGIMRLANSVIPSAFNMGSPLFPLLICLTVKLSIQHGNTFNSAFSYSSYGIILCNFCQDINTAIQFCQLALNVLDRLKAISVKSSVLTAFALFIKHRKDHTQEIIPILQEAYQTAIEMGDLEFAGYSVYGFCLASFWCGQSLVTLAQELPAYANQLAKLNQLAGSNGCLICLQYVLKLLNLTDNQTILSGQAYQAELMPQLLVNKFFGLYFYYFLYKLMICYLFYEFDKSRDYALETKNYLIAVAGMIAEAVFYFYESLSILAELNITTEAGAAALNLVTENQTNLQKNWADYAPMNYQHKVDLIAAEKCRVLGEKLEAMNLYDRAIKGAQENRYIQEEALANELAAKFYLAEGKEKIARVYMEDAHYCYQLWGATTKVKDLETRYPNLLIKTTANPKNKTATVTNTNIESDLDLTTVMKSSQAISEEINLEKLLSTLMKILIENAGAQRGYLILLNQDELFLKAFGDSETEKVQIFQYMPVNSCQFLSSILVNYVARTQATVVLNDARHDGDFLNDPYIKEQQPKSILCVPLMNQGKLVSIVYFENNLTERAFTDERQEIIKILGSQAVISIENAQLYANLEEANLTLESKVEERTHELSQALATLKATQKQLVESEKMASLGGLVAGVAHEINTPIGIGITAASTLSDKIRDFMKVFSSGQMKRSQLEQFLNAILEISEMVLNNLQRSAVMVNSFKQVAVDQTSEIKHPFQLKQYLEQCLIPLHSRLKEAGHSLTIKGDENLTINSYPGALSQIIINLTMNSIVHAYQPGEKGQIVIEFQDQGEKIELCYRDDGQGINNEDLKKIFEPFFTTKRFQGSIGLGLHIVYNLVLQKLGGEIRCESQIGMGTRFIIEFSV